MLERNLNHYKVFNDSLANASSAVMSGFLGIAKRRKGTYVSIPERLQIPENIKEQLIVELYSK